MSYRDSQLPAKRMRFSLSNLMWAILSLALALVVFVQWRDLTALRQELRGSREQLGNLSIDNSSHAYAIRVQQPDPNLWRWRVYVPPNRNYRLMQVQGMIPPRTGKKDADWLAEISKASVVERGEHSGPEISDAFNVEMSLFHDRDQWRMETKPGHDVTQFAPSFIGDWLEPLNRSESTEGLVDHQREYSDREPIVLLQLEQPISNPAVGGGTKFSEPTVPAPGIVLWLEPK